MFSNIIKILVRYISSSQGSANSAKENHQTAQPSSSQSCRNRSNQKQPVLVAAFLRVPEVVRARSRQCPSHRSHMPEAARARNSQCKHYEFSGFILWKRFTSFLKEKKQSSNMPEPNAARARANVARSQVKRARSRRRIKIEPQCQRKKPKPKQQSSQKNSLCASVSLVIFLGRSVTFPTEILLQIPKFTAVIEPEAIMHKMKIGCTRCELSGGVGFW